MKPVGLCEVTVTLGQQDFAHTFIVCKELTSSIILGLDFLSWFQTGTGWTPDELMYIHQGEQTLTEGSVNGIAAMESRLVLKTLVLLLPWTMGLAPVKVNHPELIKSNQYLQNEPDIYFQM